MKNILVIKSSPRGKSSYSSQVAEDLARRLTQDHPEASLRVRDLVESPLPTLDESLTTALRTPEEARTPEQRALLTQSDELFEELLAADTLVIASGMINFGVPAGLKNWLDHILRAGKAFRYTAEGPVGLYGGRKVYLVLASGGIYSDEARRAFDFQAPYLQSVLRFVGITDIEEIRIEGIAFGPEAAEKALEAATLRIEELVTKEPALAIR
jgi:FMN-dependent NADH-azoreductase